MTSFWIKQNLKAICILHMRSKPGVSLTVEFLLDTVQFVALKCKYNNHINTNTIIRL